MKKILLLIISMFFIGCDDLNNTPTRQVEMFFNKYQTLDKEVLDDLNDVVAIESAFNTEQREKYREIVKSNYQKLMYKVKDEEINGTSAVVTVEIEVVDYSSIVRDANKYLEEHEEEFMVDNVYDEDKFTDYKLDKLKDAKSMVKYTLKLNLTKVNNNWVLDELDSTDIEKINGMYM